MRDLYHPISIDSLFLEGNLFLAPVAGYSDRAFRSVCYQGGANFAYTEMISSEALYRSSDKTHQLMLRAPNEKQYGVQIFGGDPLVMGEAAKIVVNQVHPELIDINAGCPVPKIIKTGAGSALTRDPERLYAVTKSVVTSVAEVDSKIPVTVKIRSGWDDKTITWKEAACAALEAGAKAITLHPRTRAQGYEGKADWQKLADLVSLVSSKNKNIPVFGSGDIFSPEDAKQMLEQTQCQGVMFARGAMGNPFIFRQTKELLIHNTFMEIPISERLEIGLQELDLLIGDKGEQVACREMRKRFCGYSKGISGGAQIRLQIVAAETREDYLKLVLPYFQNREFKLQ
jgi:nifR3 family TIM-barrel protein